jgi:SET domain-containing protein
MKTPKTQMFHVRRSAVHGMGAFATRRIAKGARIIEYLGERIGHREANRRYAEKAPNDNHTFLFVVDRGIVIDAGTDGNDARFINHGCDPNCESVIENRRVYIDALRTIHPGEEIKYDYSIARDRDDPANVDEVFACHCGVEQCRGTMLWPAQRPKPRRRRRRAASKVASQAARHSARRG